MITLLWKHFELKVWRLLKPGLFTEARLFSCQFFAHNFHVYVLRIIFLFVFFCAKRTTITASINTFAIEAWFDLKVMKDEPISLDLRYFRYNALPR